MTQEPGTASRPEKSGAAATASPPDADARPAGRPIGRLLIANRGEIARRVMRTARARGITCVAVFSEPDADAPFVREADLAVALRGTTSAQTYLDAGAILDAAQRTGCDAVHPGYGFLSENAGFARAVEAAGLTWVGPPPAAIEAMAEKVPSKRLVGAAGVPLVPGAELAADATDEELLAAAEPVGYPLMVKASAGGGGKGMRVVERSADLAAAVATAQREAGSAFGDATVFLERYLPAARHIEVQVFGDSHGTVVHLFERECSIQRRHQKVVEEAPAARLSPAVRDGLHRAAVAAARAIDYVGAGTVEFLVDGDAYYFLEMNTRLQVEHPVTEEVTGLDLVAWQLDVASGAALPEPPAEPRGHAIEVRLYAEDARHDDLPSTGTITRFDLADDRLRVDTGVVAGSVVTPFYDPMLAKVIAHGRTRGEAAATLAAGLRAATIHGVTTNRDMLVAVLESRAFLDEVTTTAFLAEHPEVRTAHPSPRVLAAHALAAAAAVWAEAGAQVPVVVEGVAPAGWRNVARPGGEALVLTGESAGAWLPGGVEIHRQVRRGRERSAGPDRARWGVATPTGVAGVAAEAVDWLGSHVACEPAATGAFEVRVTDPDGVQVAARAVVEPRADGSTAVHVDGPRDHTTWLVPARFPDAEAAAAGGGPSAPVPGTVTAVLVSAGQEVAAGDALVVLEAMKMEHRVLAAADGVVSEVLVTLGDSVEAHQVLVHLVETEDA